MQSKEEKVDSSKALDADLVVTESSGTESEKHDTSSRFENDTHAKDADIKLVNDKELRDEVQLTAEHNVLANERQHYVQSEPIYDTYFFKKVDSNINHDSTNMSHRGGEIDQNAKKWKPILKPPRNQSVVRQSDAFKSERPDFSKPWFTSQVDVNNVLSKPVTPHYFPKVLEYVLAKPHHVIAPGSSGNSSKESYGSNNMVHITI
nr:hypothetical protein [Tanacetum cinerariifolium]